MALWSASLEDLPVLTGWLLRLLVVSDALGQAAVSSGQAAVSSGLIDPTGSIDTTARLGRTGKSRQMERELMVGDG